MKPSLVVRIFVPAFCIALVSAFMFFIYEPIILYAGNVDGFWFDLYDMLPLLIPIFLGVFVMIFGINVILYIVCANIFHKTDIYYYFLSILFYVFIVTYIHGNLLAGALPSLNGTPFDYHNYPIETNVSGVVCLVILAIMIFCIYKFKIRRFVKIATCISGAILIMLVVSLISTLNSTADKTLKNKNTTVATFDHYNDASRERNFFILLVDTIDAETFSRLLKDDSAYQETMKDFTYYPDTTSYHPFTLYSMPVIFSQTPRQNEASFEEYSSKAFANSPILNKLYSDGYKMYMFDYELVMSGETADRFGNMRSVTKIDQAGFYKELMCYIGFKYLPFLLKDKVHIEDSNFYESAQDYEVETFRAYDEINYNIYNNEPINVVDDKVFHMVHLEGAHQPLNLDENVKRISSSSKGTYDQKVLASFKLIQAYLKRLKEAGVYNNSSIIIMSDHGYKDVDDYSKIGKKENVTGCFNPILYIKGVDEKHEEMIYSDKPISHLDLGEAYDGLLAGKASTELFGDISYPRVRKMSTFGSESDDDLMHMVEYETSSPAWEEDKIIPTGNEFVVNP